MHSTANWQRVSRTRPCPVCGKTDWCCFTGDPNNPAAVICPRVESPKRAGDAGWLHVLRDDGRYRERWRRTILVPMPSTSMDSAQMAGTCSNAVQPEALQQLADKLGLTVTSLARLGTGWSVEHRAWAFPMRDASGLVKGIRLRLPDGRKLSVRGGHEGLFIPADLPSGESLLICEGPTDTAALLDLGFPAVGRPSCLGGVRLLVDLVHRHKPPEVVIVADGDSPGRRGAEALAAVLVAHVPRVRVIEPPAGIKDARGWKQHGATSADVQAVIDATPVRRLKIQVQHRSKHHG